MSRHTLSNGQCKRFHAEGFLRLPGFLSKAELSPLCERLEADPGMFCRVGALGWIGWTEPANDLAGCLTRFEPIVDGAESLVGEQCYHWHSKIVNKPPGGEQTLAWHQDFGSWYKDGCLRPKLVTCVIALTPAASASGCMRLLRGSHRLGRLDRLPDGIEEYSYFRLNPQRLEAILRRFPVEEMQMTPGDAFFFHANTLHSSDANTTDRPRTLLEMTYNAMSNGPVFEGQEIHAPRVLHRKSKGSLLEGDYDTVIDRTRLIDINDPADPGLQIFRRRFDPGLC
jgi:ectoine hydroxylase